MFYDEGRGLVGFVLAAHYSMQMYRVWPVVPQQHPGTADMFVHEYRGLQREVGVCRVLLSCESRLYFNQTLSKVSYITLL